MLRIAMSSISAHFTLRDVAAGAGREHAPDIQRRLVHHQREHPKTLVTGSDFSNQLKAVAADERKLDDYQIGTHCGDRT